MNTLAQVVSCTGVAEIVYAKARNACPVERGTQIAARCRWVHRFPSCLAKHQIVVLPDRTGGKAFFKLLTAVLVE
jgi:hypothetical protein